MAPMTAPPWDTKAPNENVIAWQNDGWIHGEVLDIGCGLGDNAVYLAKNGHAVTGLDISPTALTTAEQRAKDAGVNVKFAVSGHHPDRRLHRRVRHRDRQRLVPLPR
jgi:methylase of polypeptide subunit release factors